MAVPNKEALIAPKADASDFAGRFREIISDPINLLIARHPLAGTTIGTDVVLHNGLRVPAHGPTAYYGDFSSILILNRGVHEPLEEYCFQELLPVLPDAPKMLEMGAYWGHYSMWLKHCRPDATVIMVEPDPQNMATGQANFARNELEGEFINAFVGRGHFDVDSFLQSRGWEHLNILHSDIQGYEVEMTENCKQSFSAAKIDYVFISTHSPECHSAIIDCLKSHDYKINAESDFDEQTTSYDGLVFASSPKVSPIFKDMRHFGRREIARASVGDLVEFIADQYGCTNRRT